MKINNFKLVVIAWILSQTACASQPEVASMRRTQAVELERKIRAIQDEAAMPGLQVVVSEDEQSVFEYAQGIRAQGHPEQITSEDKWHIGSCTKPMTAFLIGQLVDEKIIKWTTTLGEIAPKDFQLDSRVKTITVEQLLSHSGGLADVIEPDNGKLWPSLFTDKVAPQIMREKLVKGILKMPGRFQPGSQSQYSNSGYIVLGWIVELMRSDSWENVLKKQMFQKLGMNSCGFGPAGIESLTSATQPWAHKYEKNQLQALPPGILADNPPALGPAGTVHCSTRDWHKFLRLFVENEGVHSGFLTESTYNKLLSNAAEPPYTFSSMGRTDRPWAKGVVFAMAGSNTFNFALVAIAPSLHRIFTVNTNAGHAKADEGATQILKLLTELK